MAAENRPHPVKKALNVWRPPRAAEKRKLPTKKFLDPEDADGRLFSRLLNSYNLLRDPVEQLIYPGLRRKRPKKGSNIEKGTIHVIRNDPITVPTCCTLHQKEVAEVVEDHRSYLYNSPIPTLPCILSAKDRCRLERLSVANNESNSRRQLPFSTVVVRWRNTGRTSATRAYNTETLYDIMSQCGPVTSIYTTSPCSAYIVFLNLSDSCDAILARDLGQINNRLYCYWLHPNMDNKLFYLGNKGVRVSSNQFILPSV